MKAAVNALLLRNSLSFLLWCQGFWFKITAVPEWIAAVTLHLNFIDLLALKITPFCGRQAWLKLCKQSFSKKFENTAS